MKDLLLSESYINFFSLLICLINAIYFGYMLLSKSSDPNSRRSRFQSDSFLQGLGRVFCILAIFGILFLLGPTIESYSAWASYVPAWKR